MKKFLIGLGKFLLIFLVVVYIGLPLMGLYLYLIETYNPPSVIILLIILAVIVIFIWLVALPDHKAPKFIKKFLEWDKKLDIKTNLHNKRYKKK